MRKQYGLRTGMVLTATLSIMLLIPQAAMSVQFTEEDTTTVFDPTGMLRLQANLFRGIGSDKHLIGVTTENKDVTISGGGGLGFELEAGFSLNSTFEISGAYGFQKSSLSQKMENTEVGFKRSFMRSTLKVRLPISDHYQINIGAGGGYYSGGDLDLDLSKVNLPGAAHVIYSYKGAPGFHVMGGFEELLSPSSTGSSKLFGGIGLRYSSVKYDLESVTNNGLSIPINSLPQDVKDEMMKLDGSGLDILLYLTIYF